MAARFYLKGKEHILNGDVPLLTDDVSILLVSDTYEPDTSIDESRAAIPDAAIIAEATLEGKMTANGVFTADDLTFNEVTGDTIKYVVLALDSAQYSNAWLLAILKDDVAITPDGSDITMTFAETGILRI